MESILEHLEFLSVKIGPRGPTSANEKKAAEYIEQIMKQNGLEVTVEVFKSLTSFAQVFCVTILLEIVAVLVFPLSVFVAFLLSLMCLLFLVTEMDLKPTVSRLLPRSSSQNVVGKILPKEKSEKRVVLMGHCDSNSPLLFNHPRVVEYFSVFYLTGFASSLSLVLLSGLAAVFQVVGLISVNFILWYASFPLAGYLVSGLLVFVEGQVLERPTNGANDDASGVSVILGVAERLSKEPLKNTEVWCVATGCEEAGTVGTINFLKRHAHELENAYFLTMDCVGKGNLRYMIQEGTFTAIRAPTEIVELVDEAARNIAQEVEAKPVSIRFHASDAFPLLQRGFKAMGIVTLAEHNMPANLHWKTDVFENIDAQTISNAFKFVSEILRTIDSRR